MYETLANVLNRDALLELAGERAFERGMDYFAEGRVVGLKEEKGTTTARVRGTSYYRVKLWAEDGEVAFDCNCPVGQDDVFCKHGVAVGLAWLEQRQQKTGVRRHQTR